MKLILLLSLYIGYVSCQVNIHGHDLALLVQKGFTAIDMNHNGVLEDSEFEAAAKARDTNGDGKVSCDEYASRSSLPKELAIEVFHHLDGASNDCLMDHDDVVADLRSMDHNGDGSVTEKEFEHYFLQIMKHLGHVDHSHHG